MHMKHFTTIIFIFLCLTSFSQSQERRDYILKYKDIAIKEMLRSGIPASITLAQAAHESGNGKSTLAVKGNNHFGIKHLKDWKGGIISLNAKNPNSSYRKYDNVESSFRDHSDLLTSKNRYAPLFKLAPNDYKAWAKGLKDAGYATAVDYAEKLIAIIEKERLYEFDKIENLETL